MIYLLAVVATLLVGLTMATEIDPQYIIRPEFDELSPHWNDTDGNRIEAHSAGMLLAGDGQWYWYGESKKSSDPSDHGVSCYSSPTLAGPWKNLGLVLTQDQIVGTFMNLLLTNLI